MKRKKFAFFLIFFILSLFGGFFFLKERYNSACENVINYFEQKDFKCFRDQKLIILRYSNQSEKKTKKAFQDLLKYNIKIISYVLKEDFFEIICKPTEENINRIFRNNNQREEYYSRKKKYNNVDFIFKE